MTSGSVSAPTPIAAADEPVLLTLSTDGNVFRLGDPIVLRIEVKNTSPVSKAFPKDPIDLDLGVVNAKHEMLIPNKEVEVYSVYPLGTVPPDPDVHLEPGATYSMPAITTEKLGVRISDPGTYSAVIFYRTATSPIFSNTISFTVR